MTHDSSGQNSGDGVRRQGLISLENWASYLSFTKLSVALICIRCRYGYILTKITYVLVLKLYEIQVPSCIFLLHAFQQSRQANSVSGLGKHTLTCPFKRSRRKRENQTNKQKKNTMHIGLQTPSATCLERPATNSIYKAQHKHLPWRFCKAIILINQVSFNKAQATKTATCCKPRQATDPGFPLPVPSLCNTCHRLLHKAQEPQVTTALTCLNSSTHFEDRSSSQRHKVTQFYMECQGTILQLLLTKTNYMASVC